MNKIIIDENTVKNCKWYQSFFVLDCALDGENTINRKCKINYFEYKGKYYTISDIDKNEFIELPLYLSDVYPNSTGVVLDKSLELPYIGQHYRVLFPSFFLPEISEKIDNIERVRKIDDPNILSGYKEEHDNWVPKCLKDSGRKLSLNDAWAIYHKYHLHGGVIKNEYTWLLVPIFTPEYNDHNELIKFYVPVVFSKNSKPLTYTNINGWEELVLPVPEANNKGGFDSFSKMLGAAYNYDSSKTITVEEAVEWFNNQDNVLSLQKIVTAINNCKDYDLDYDSFIIIKDIIPMIDDLISNNESTFDILSLVRSQLHLNNGGREMIKDCLIQNIGEKIRRENCLSPEMLQQFLTIPPIPAFDSGNMTDVITAGDKCSVYKYSALGTRNISWSIPTYFNINGVDFYDLDEFDPRIEIFQKRPSEQVNKAFNNFISLLTEILNSVIDNENSLEKKDYEKTIIHDNQYMTARGMAVLLNKNFYDIFIELLENKEPDLSFKCYFISDNSLHDHTEIRHVEIFIHNLDIDNVDLVNLDNYYSYEDIDLSKILLNTKFDKGKSIVKSNRMF